MTIDLTSLTPASLNSLGPRTMHEVREQTCAAVSAKLKDSKETKFPIVDCSALTALAPDDLVNELQSARFGAPRILILPGSSKPDTDQALADFKAKIARIGKHTVFYNQGDVSNRDGRLVEFMQRLDAGSAMKAKGGQQVADGLRTLIASLQADVTIIDGTALKDDFPGELLARSNLTAPTYIIDTEQPLGARLSAIRKADLGKCEIGKFQKLHLEPATVASLRDCLADKVDTLDLSRESKLDKLPGALVDALRPNLKVVKFDAKSSQALRMQFKGIQSLIIAEADQSPVSIGRGRLGNETMVRSTSLNSLNPLAEQRVDDAENDVVAVATDEEVVPGIAPREARTPSVETLASRGQPEGEAHDAQAASPGAALSNCAEDSPHDSGAPADEDTLLTATQVAASADASANPKAELQQAAPPSMPGDQAVDNLPPPAKRRNFVTRFVMKIGEYFAGFWRLFFGARPAAKEHV